MIIDQIYSEGQGLPDSLLKEVLHYMRYLRSSQNIDSEHTVLSDNEGSSQKRTSVLGVLNKKSDNDRKDRSALYGKYKGTMIISDDFDEPLEDFAEYM